MSWVDDFLSAAREVAEEADELVPKLRVRPADVVVNVHSYAWRAFEALLRQRYSDGAPRIAALSMNPARNGAVQTGMAFTDAPTARTLFADFDRLVKRPPGLATERAEMSGQKLRLWAERDLGGWDGLYRRLVFPIACPVAILRGPNLLNIPIASLNGAPKQAAESFYEWSAPLLIRAARPVGVLLLGDYAGKRWAKLSSMSADLARLPAAVTHHPAARMANDRKLNDWSKALSRLEGARTRSGSPIRAIGARR